MARRRSVPVSAPARGADVAAGDLPGTADAGTIDLPTPIIRSYVAPSSAEFRHQAVLLTRSTNVPVTHVARELGISIGTLRDWSAKARHAPRQLHEGTSETGQQERRSDYRWRSCSALSPRHRTRPVSLGKN